MSKNTYRQTNDKSSEGQVYDDSYTTKGRRDGGGIPVLKDDDNVEDPINSEEANSDKQLQRDEAEAIDKNNMLKEKTRGKQPRGSYKEPTDEEFGLTEGS
ncbi:hypothetical protein F4804DRAFT_339295 [Jackrogersella minutella]|nr:hypothetical protein F4804DRAFT_339295 [Jackrogersella minutella]